MPPGTLLLCDADLEATSHRCSTAEGRPRGRRIRRAPGRRVRNREADRPSPRSSPQRLRGPRAALGPARAVAGGARGVLPLAAGFGCEVRMTIDAARAGLRVAERRVAAPPPRDRPRPTGLRPPRTAAARRRARLWPARDQLPRPSPPARRRPGRTRWSKAPARVRVGVAAIALLGLADDLWSGPERGFRAHLARGSTTGVAKAVGIPCSSTFPCSGVTRA